MAPKCPRSSPVLSLPCAWLSPHHSPFHKPSLSPLLGPEHPHFPFPHAEPLWILNALFKYHTTPIPTPGKVTKSLFYSFLLTYLDTQWYPWDSIHQMYVTTMKNHSGPKTWHPDLLLAWRIISFFQMCVLTPLPSPYKQIIVYFNKIQSSASAATLWTKHPSLQIHCQFQMPKF